MHRACTLIKTSPCSGTGVGRSLRTSCSGPPNWLMTIDCIENSFRCSFQLYTLVKTNYVSIVEGKKQFVKGEKLGNHQEGGLSCQIAKSGEYRCAIEGNRIVEKEWKMNKDLQCNHPLEKSIVVQEQNDYRDNV